MQHVMSSPCLCTLPSGTPASTAQIMLCPTTMNTITMITISSHSVACRNFLEPHMLSVTKPAPAKNSRALRNLEGFSCWKQWPCPEIARKWLASHRFSGSNLCLTPILEGGDHLLHAKSG